jgi:hypothetical protein
VGTQLLAQFVFPGGLAVEPLFAMDFDHQYLQAVAAEASKPGTAMAASRSRPSPAAALKRRVLLAQLAPTEAKRRCCSRWQKPKALARSGSMCLWTTPKPMPNV